jgi:hypothetical protein
MTDRGSNPGRRYGKPVPNRLNYGHDKGIKPASSTFSAGMEK